MKKKYLRFLFMAAPFIVTSCGGQSNAPGVTSVYSSVHPDQGNVTIGIVYSENILSATDAYSIQDKIANYIITVYRTTAEYEYRKDITVTTTSNTIYNHTIVFNYTFPDDNTINITYGPYVVLGNN